jgi:succinyl-diaminopimelate desuccinylase
MKGGLAVMVELALGVPEPAVDVTYVFYAREEIAAKESGLEELFVERPDLLVGDVAILGEPTDGEVEAGCQGTLRLAVTLAGARAHSARPWMGRNAIHRLGPLLDFLAAHEPRQPVLGGLQFREALQAVLVDGGVAANVVPDSVTLTLNHRFAPDRTPAEAEQVVRDLLAPFLEEGDVVELVDASPGAAPALDHPLLAALVERNGLGVRAKLGWTDVARFAARGVPAVNLGAGDSTLAHHLDERVDGDRLDHSYRSLHDLITVGA